tara:strand:+ start:616 stop:927 length:312 start_codon:yes stop_codon:yes gene_type:complete
VKQPWEDKPFQDHLLYVVDGELLNHMIKLMKAFKLSPELEMTLPQYEKVLNYMIKSIIQCSNYPTGEEAGEIDYIDFENWLWKCGIRLPNDEDPNNQWPEEDQ